KRLDKMAHWRYATAFSVPLEAAETREHFRTPPEDLPYKDAPIGSSRGSHWGTVWFRGTIEIPKELRGQRIYYRHRHEGERLLFVNRQPAAGMDPYHEEVLLSPKARNGEQYSIYVEAYCGHPIYAVDTFDPKPVTMHDINGISKAPPPLVLHESAVVVEREVVTGFLYDAEVLYRTALILDENALRRVRILEVLRTVLDKISLQWQDEKELNTMMTAARKQIAPLLKLKNGPTAPTVGIVGHAHIDVAWLWPVRESIRKSARTFSTVLNLMDAYPKLTFQQSQAALYDMVERHYPELMTRIRKRVKEGRWEPNGGMWVEADCNISSGESLVRQLLEGRKKFVELFGYKGDTLWLPDVFGYAAALPQILKLSDIENFVTSKINCNDTNRFPYDTFWWRGLDGTEIFTSYITTRTNSYNADVLPEIMQETWDFVQQKELQDHVLTSVGWGDGGGGPSREMCERALRMNDLEGCPKTTFTNVSRFLKELREQSVERPRWSGELYLEYHRGTYTAQARTKKWNRKLELLLRETEFFATLSLPDGFDYPARELEAHWRTLLTNQFHDILPGTSIREVYDIAEEEYETMYVALLQMRDAALETLAQRFIPDTEGQEWIIGNALSWNRSPVVELPVKDFNGAVDENGTPLPAQKTTDGLALKIPLCSLGVITVAMRHRENNDLSPFSYTGKSLETPLYQVKFDKAGRITSLFDKEAAREVVRSGKTLNTLYTAEDMPLYWDAWNIDRYYRDTIRDETRLIKREVTEDGPLFITIHSEYSLGRRSTLRQDMRFYADSRCIEWRTEVDWHEKHTLLKVGFAVDICADTWRNEIQFGHAVRNMHSNTSWDQAQFEVCAHKWVDVSESGYGVALLNDCKYGHDSLDDMISLTLLRSPQTPAPETDQGTHTFTYALLPHNGDFSVDTVVHEAYALNLPPAAVKIKTQSENELPEPREENFFCEVSPSNIIVEAVKKAEYEDAAIIRLYEAGKKRSSVTVRFPSPVKKVSICNLMEEKDQTVPLDEDSVSFEMRPFEIKTLKVTFR
ncbi:MAG: alpha-mannosidase, partial [Candidatus Hydrogenedentes bacterium]|nr:alpha-mannosidase [Candidatus Hydrogenedentota bacterium]